MTHDIFPPELVVKSIRDSGYKNAAYAIAELVDNSIQAGANLVELHCFEKSNNVGQRIRWNVSRIAVVDNGAGMDADVLRLALQFGNGTHLNDRKGIGRFGMGLPNSSLSQAKKVEVWSWQQGSESAMYSYLDVDEIRSGAMKSIPSPENRPLPVDVVEKSSEVGDSGTIVVWSDIDRCAWKTGKAIIGNSEALVGRIYRRFLNDGRVKLRLASHRSGDLVPSENRLAIPNDPMYLMKDTSCPAPWRDTPMFEPWGDTPQQDVKIRWDDGEHVVTIRYAYAKKEARQGHNPGNRDYGKHAARNNGVSIVRADREIELDPSWMPGYDPVCRWMGVEVEFPPALDEIFGVTNNKQSATHFNDLAGTDKEVLAERFGFKSYEELKEAWHGDGDPRYPLLVIQDSLVRNIRALHQLLDAQTRRSRTKKSERHPSSPESKATEATKERIKNGRLGESDKQEEASTEDRTKDLEKSLQENGLDTDEAEKVAKATVDSGLKYVFTHAESTSGAFFNVRASGGALTISLNINHPAYKNLVAILESQQDGQEHEENPEVVKEQLSRALDGLKLLLSAWARFEDEQPDDRRYAVQETREDWGRVARQFLKE